jgi:hypothetical protein
MKVDEAECVEAPWHVENTKFDEAGCVETPAANSNMPGCVETLWHVEPSPFMAMHVENRKQKGRAQPLPARGDTRRKQGRD